MHLHDPHGPPASQPPPDPATAWVPCHAMPRNLNSRCWEMHRGPCSAHRPLSMHDPHLHARSPCTIRMGRVAACPPARAPSARICTQITCTRNDPCTLHGLHCLWLNDACALRLPHARSTRCRRSTAANSGRWCASWALPRGQLNRSRH
jgi:hypothetical protein